MIPQPTLGCLLLFDHSAGLNWQIDGHRSVNQQPPAVRPLFLEWETEDLRPVTILVEPHVVPAGHVLASM